MVRIENDGQEFAVGREYAMVARYRLARKRIAASKARVLFCQISPDLSRNVASAPYLARQAGPGPRM